MKVLAILGFTFTEMGGLEYDTLALRGAQGTGLRLVELWEIIYGNSKPD